MTALLEARHVSKTYSGGVLDRDTVVALQAFSLTLEAERPRIIAIVGESGSGKTTPARLLLGLVAPTTGEGRRKSWASKTVGHPAAGLSSRRAGDLPGSIRRLQSVLPGGPRAHHAGGPSSIWQRPGRRGVALIEELYCARSACDLRRFSGGSHTSSAAANVSVMVARALLLRPHLIVADEPVSMVDASLRATILGVVAPAQPRSAASRSSTSRTTSPPPIRWGDEDHRDVSRSRWPKPVTSSWW